VRQSGKPGQVKGREPTEQPKVRASICSLSSSMFMGTIIDFE
jgi:hypothetical protein